MKIEDNIINDTFSVSNIIGNKLLQGWTLLNSTCCFCNVTPLIGKRNKGRYCVRCDVFIKIDQTANEAKNAEAKNAEVKNAETNKEIATTAEAKNAETTTTETTTAETQNEFEWTTTKCPIKYIKEIKLQNGEFSELLNKKKISKDEITNAFEYKNYIKEKCGDNVEEWLTFNHSCVTNKKIENENVIDDTKHNVDMENEKNDENGKNDKNGKNDENDKNDDAKLNGKLPDYINEFDYNKDNKAEKEMRVFNKTKSIFIDMLEKYVDKLSNNVNSNEETEYINKIISVINVLEKITNLKNAGN